VKFESLRAQPIFLQSRIFGKLDEVAENPVLRASARAADPV